MFREQMMYVITMIRSILILWGSLWLAQAVHAQGVLYSDLNAVPLALNPAFTGMFNGSMRCNAAGRTLTVDNGDLSATTGYFSFDARSRDTKNESYWGLGGELGYGVTGTAPLQNQSGSLSFAWHKRFGTDGTRHSAYGFDVGAGVQAAYYSQQYNAQVFYFSGNPFPPVALTGNYSGGVVNGGVSFAHILSDKVNYVAGFSCTLFGQASDAVLERHAAAVGLQSSYNTTLGANIKAWERLSIRPAAMVMVSQQVRLMAGTDATWRLGPHAYSTHIFAGLWYRTENVVVATAGVAKGKIRVCAALDRGLSFTEGGYPIAAGLSLTYIGFGKPLKRSYSICNRF